MENRTSLSGMLIAVLLLVVIAVVIIGGIGSVGIMVADWQTGGCDANKIVAYHSDGSPVNECVRQFTDALR